MATEHFLLPRQAPYAQSSSIQGRDVISRASDTFHTRVVQDLENFVSPREANNGYHSVELAPLALKKI